MASDPKLTTEELAKQAQKVKRTTDTISVLKEKAKIAKLLVESIWEPLKEVLLGDAKFVDTFALAVAKRITTNGEALKVLLDNPDMFDKIVAGVTEELQKDMPTVDGVAAKLVDTVSARITDPVADKVINPVVLKLKPTLEELGKSYLATGATVSPLSSRKGAISDEVPAEMMSAKLSPHTNLTQEQLAVLDMFAKNPEAFQLIARNYPRLKATCEDIANAEIMAVLLSDDSQEKMFDLLHQDPETTLKALFALTGLTPDTLKDNLAKVARQDSEFNLLRPAEFEGMLNEAAERVPGMMFACMVRQTALALNDVNVENMVKRLSALGSIYNQGLLKSLDSIASRKSSDDELTSALACEFPRPADIVSALENVRKCAKSQLANVLDSQFSDAIKSNNQEEELFMLVSFAPGYILGRLRFCVRDSSYLESVAGANLASDDSFRDELKQSYENVLLRHAGRLLQDSITNGKDPQEAIKALKAEGHDAVSALVSIANDTVLSTPAVRSAAKDILMAEMISYQYYRYAEAEGTMKKADITEPLPIFNDENLSLELYGSIYRMSDEDRKKAVLSAFGVSVLDHERQARDALTTQYAYEVRRRVFNALVLSDEAAARSGIDALGPDHKHMIDAALQTLRRSATAAEEFDDNGDYAAPEAKIAIMRRASLLRYHKDSIELVAAALSLDATKAAISAEDELEHLYETAPATTLKHLSSLHDTFTLSAALATVLGKTVSKEYLDDKATIVEGMYGSLMVAETVVLLRDSAFSTRIRNLETDHQKAAIKSALKHVLADEATRKDELGKILHAAVDSEDVAKDSLLITRRARDCLYDFKGRVRVASAVLDQDADDLEAIFNANMWDTLSDLKELQEGSVLRRDLFEIMGGSPDDVIMKAASTFVEGYYGTFLIGAIVNDLSKEDSRRHMKEASSEHPGDWQAALKLIIANENGLIDDDVAKLSPASLDTTREFIINLAKMHLAIDEMKSKVLTTLATSSEPAQGLPNIWLQNPDVASLALQDLTDLSAEALNDRMSEAAGAPGRRYPPEIFKQKYDALKTQYARSVRMLVVRAQGYKAPSERLKAMEALFKEHNAEVSQAVSTLLSDKTLVVQEIVTWTNMGGGSLDKSKIKELSNFVTYNLKSINQGGRK